MSEDEKILRELDAAEAAFGRGPMPPPIRATLYEQIRQMRRHRHLAIRYYVIGALYLLASSVVYPVVFANAPLYGILIAVSIWNVGACLWFWKAGREGLQSRQPFGLITVQAVPADPE